MKKSKYVKIVIICAVIFLFVSIGIGLIIDHAVKAKKTNATNTDNTQVETTVEEDTTASDIKLAIQNLLTKIEIMEANFETLETLNTELRERNASLNSEKNSLQTEQNYANSQIAELKGSLTNIKNAYEEIITYYATVSNESRTNLENIQNEYNSLWARFIEFEQDNTTLDIKANNENNLKFDVTVNSLVNNSIAKATISNSQLKLSENLKVYVNNELLKNYSIYDRRLTASSDNYTLTFYYYADKIHTFAFEGLQTNDTYTVEFKQIEESETNIVRWTFEDTTNYCYIEDNTINLTVVAQDRLLELESIKSSSMISSDSAEYYELIKRTDAKIYLNGLLLLDTKNLPDTCKIFYNAGYDDEHLKYVYPGNYTIVDRNGDNDISVFDTNIINLNFRNSNSGSTTAISYIGGIDSKLALNNTELTVNIEWIFETYRIN